MIASFWTTGAIAVVFLVGGVVGWISNLARSGRMGRWVCFWRLVVSTLFLVAGGSMISNFRDPVEAAEQVAAFALAIGIVFLLKGLWPSSTALQIPTDRVPAGPSPTV